MRTDRKLKVRENFLLYHVKNVQSQPPLQPKRAPKLEV